MTRELGKSILLFLLVVLSLTLTWSIWSYQGNYAPTNSSQPTNVSSIASAYNPGDVIRPYQMIRFSAAHRKVIQGLFGNSVTPLYKLVLSAHLTPQATLPNNFPKAVGNSYELDFPTPISSTTIKNLFNFTQANTSSISQDWLIDRVTIFQTQSTTENAYVVFKDQTGQPIFYATGDIPGLHAFSKNYASSDNWLAYTELKLKGHSVYVPNETIKTVAIENHLYSTIGFDLYKPILFSDPRQLFFSGNSYSDGVSQLVDRQKLVMQYFNAVSGGTTGSYGDPIWQSYNWVNSHKGWTNTFNIDNYTAYPAKGQAEVTYRLTENGIPVFSTIAYPYEYESEIYMMYNGGELSKLDRTLINVGVSYKQPKQQVMVTPIDTIKLLKKTGAFQLDKISDFRLGYGMTLNQKEQSVTFTPSWFFKQGGTWISVTDFLNSHSSTIQGTGGVSK